MSVKCMIPDCDKSWSRDPVLEVACPDCKQPVGSPCKRPSGHRATQPHAARDILADELGHYGPCPLNRCGLANKPKQLSLL